MPPVPKLSKTELDLFVPSRPYGCRYSASFRLGFLVRGPPRSIHRHYRVPVSLSRPLRASAAVSDSTTTASDTGTSNQVQAAVSEAELARRQKISNANRGKVPWNKGVPRTDEEKQKIKASVQVAMQRPDVQGRLRSWQGRTHSSETKEVISQRMKESHLERRQGAPKPPKKKKPKVVRTAEEEALLKEQRRQKLSEAIKAKWKDPEYRAKMDAIIAARTGSGTALAASPGFRQRRNEARRAKTAQRNADAKADLAFARERLCKLNNARRQVIELDAAIKKLRSEMHLFRSDPDAEERALAAIAKAEWTHDSAQAAIASLSGQAPSLQELMDAAGAQPATPTFAHHLRLEEEEFAQGQPTSSQPAGTRSPTSSTDSDNDVPFQPVHYQNGVIAQHESSPTTPGSSAVVNSLRSQATNMPEPTAQPSSSTQHPVSKPSYAVNGAWSSEAIHSMTSNGHSSPDSALIVESLRRQSSEQQSTSPELLSSSRAGEHGVSHDSDAALERSSWADNTSSAQLPHSEAASTPHSEASHASGTNGASNGLNQALYHDQVTADQSGDSADAPWISMPDSAGQAAEARPMPDSQAAAGAAPSTSGRGSRAGSKSPATPLRMTFGQPGPSKPPGAGRMPGSASPPNSRTLDAASAKLVPDAAPPATLPGRSLPGAGTPQPIKRPVKGHSKAYMRGRGSVMGRPSTNQRPASDRHWGAAAFPARHLTNQRIGVLAALLC